MEKFPDLPDDTTKPPVSLRPDQNATARPTYRRHTSTLNGNLPSITGAAVSTLTPRPSILKEPQATKIPESSLPRKGRKRRKVRSLFRRWKHLSFKHTWVNPLIAMLTILALYLINPTESNPLRHAIFLSYPLQPGDPRIPSHVVQEPGVPQTTYYSKGRYDFAFVGFYIIVLSFTREFIMQQFLRPWAKRAGLRSHAKQSRFMEQAYTAIYFSIFGPLGMYVMYRSPFWYFNTDAMFDTFPHKSNDVFLKSYYLLQAAYWAQQFIVLCLLLEKPRKDFKELVMHHIVTLALIWLSYYFHFTYIGVAIYITHDISDFFLATSKTLNYLESEYVVPYFAFFVAVWVYLRHYINLRIIYAVATDFATIGPYELNWETEQYKCWLSQYVTLGLLGTLQAINLFWLAMIIKVALNVVLANNKTDVRSDDEDEEEDDVEVKEKAPELVQVRDSTMDSKRNDLPKVLHNGEGVPKIGAVPEIVLKSEADVKSPRREGLRKR